MKHGETQQSHSPARRPRLAAAVRVCGNNQLRGTSGGNGSRTRSILVSELPSGFPFGGGVTANGEFQDLSPFLGTLPEGLIVTARSFPTPAAFQCAGGDVQCLIDAINTSNRTGGVNTIQLNAATYQLTTPDNVETNSPGRGGNGLPVIVARIAIVGVGPESTIIERESTADQRTENEFRFFHVANTGQLDLRGVTLRNGNAGDTGQGGSILSEGSLVLEHAVITDSYAGRAAAIQVLGG